MRQGMLNVVAILMLVQLSCSGSRFKVVDAATGAPLTGVQVTRGGARQVASGRHAPTRTPLGLTRPDGTFVSDTLRQRPVLFSKDGYKTASVAFPDSRAWVVSPMEDAVWRPTEDDERHLGEVLPTSHYRIVSRHRVIRVPMWPTAPMTDRPQTQESR